MNSKKIAQLLLKFQTKYRLGNDLKSIEKLETIMDGFIKSKTDDTELHTLLPKVWASFYRKALVQSFKESKEIDNNKVQLFDGEIIDTEIAISNYLHKKEGSSLFNQYAEIRRRYFNAQNNSEEQKDLQQTEQCRVTLSQYLNALGLGMFTPINSTDDYIKIEENKLQVRIVLNHYEMIYPALKELKEYEELRKIPLSSKEARQKLDEIKEIVAAKGNPKKMAILSYEYFTGEEIKQDYKEAFYWTEKSAQKSDATGMYYLGCFFLKGVGCTKDIETGKHWFGKGIIMGLKEAETLLKNMDDTQNNVEN